MSVFDKAKDAADTVVDKVKDKELGDDFFTNFIIKQTAKQEHINEILKSKGSSYHLWAYPVKVGIPPKAVYSN